MSPHGLEAINAFYGDPAPYVRGDGSVSPLWEARMTYVLFPAPLRLDWVPAGIARGARVNQAIADLTERTFATLEREGLWGLIPDFSGGYAWRPQRGQRGSSTKMSLHSWGAALDFDYSGNPLGKVGRMHLEVVNVFRAYGWTWGGTFQRRDDGHFQYASGY